jgi:hypothetical protein
MLQKRVTGVIQMARGPTSGTIRLYKNRTRRSSKIRSRAGMNANNLNVYFWYFNIHQNTDET